MDNANLALYVATYADATSAQQDFQSLNDAKDDDFRIVGAIVMNRDADGKVEVVEHGDEDAASGAVIGGGVGLIVGLFAPPLLLSMAVGAGAGAVAGHFIKRHEEKKMGVDLEEYLPPGTSAVVVVLDDQYLDRVDKALAKADKKVTKAIESGDYDKLREALSKSASDVADAIDS